MKRQLAPVAGEGRLKIDGPKEPAHLVGKILFGDTAAPGDSGLTGFV